MMHISKCKPRIPFRLMAALLIIGATLSAPVSGFAQEQVAQSAVVTAIAPAQSNRIVAVTGTDGAQLRETPTGRVSQILPVGQVVTVTGRTAARDWLFVSLADGITGWVAAEELVVFGVDRLPMVSSETGDGGMVDGEMVSSGGVVPTVIETETSVAVDRDVDTVRSTTSDVVTDSTVTDSTVTDSTITNVTASTLTGQVTLLGSRLNIRAGPATSYAIVGKAQPAQPLTLLGRNGAGDWVQVQLVTASAAQTDVAFGWVASRYLEATGELTALPVVESISTSPTYQEPAQSSVNHARANVPVTAQSASAANTTTTGVVDRPASRGSATDLTGTLVFQSGPGGMLYAYRLETGELWRLSNGFDPAISPDGQTVAFVREGGENGIYLIDIDGSNERLIFSGRTRLSSPKWSPDGHWILFTRSDEYTACVNVGRGGCLDVNALPPGFPADTLELSKDYEYNLAAVDVAGGNYHDIAALESARVADWNEAGIVYQSSAGLQITADREDAENRLLLFIPLQPPHEDPDWQPNGGKVAFVQRHGSHYEIFTINPDGSGMAALTRPVTTLVDQMPNNLAPAWSPDGQQIVFLSNRDTGHEAGAWRIWVMDADGSNQRPLPIDVSINYTYGNEQAVSWGV